MNNINKNELFSGAISHNFRKERIYFADTRKKQKEICDVVMNKIDRGVTLLHSRSGYQNEEQEVILTVVSKREY